MFRASISALVILCLTATPALAAVCEIHPHYNAQMRKSLIDALYRVRSQSHLAQILAQMIVIDREVTAHEEAHYNAAQGWADLPVYEIVELYGKQYRIGGCVSFKSGVPLEIAYRALLAPKEPSGHDMNEARKVMLAMQRRGMR